MLPFLEKRDSVVREQVKKKSPELEDLKQAPGHAGVEEVHLSGVDFLQQEQQSSTPPPLSLPAVPHSHISPLWPFTPFTPHPCLSRGRSISTCDIPTQEKERKKGKK